MQGVALNRVLIGAPLTVGVGVALVAGAIAAMNRVKSGGRWRGGAGARSTTHVSQGG